MGPACNELGSSCGPPTEDSSLLSSNSVPYVQLHANSTRSGNPSHLEKRAALNPASFPQARDEMTFLSTYPLKDRRPILYMTNYGNNYVYDNSAGKDVTVYVVGEVS